MGLFSFIKEAGRRLGIGKAEATQPEGSPAADPPTVDELRQEVETLGLAVKDPKIEVAGDKVRVAGEVPDQAAKERLVLALGNVAGVASVEEQVTVAAAAPSVPEATFYTVKKGDTLWAVAKAHYGEGGKFNAIFEANRPMLKDPDKIYPGQTLRIPPEPA